MKKPTIRFWLRSDRQNLDGTCPVHLIYQIKGQRKYFATDIKLFPCNWDLEHQRAVYINKRTAKQLMPNRNFALDFPTVKEIENVNDSLSDLESRIKGIETVFTANKSPFTVSMAINKLKEDTKGYAVKERSINDLFEFMDRYIGDNKHTREPGSLSSYRTTKKHIADFQAHTKMELGFDKMDYNFFQSFQNYLISEKKLNNNTVAKILSTVKTFLNYARKNGIEVSDRYKDFRIYIATQIMHHKINSLSLDFNKSLKNIL